LIYILVPNLYLYGYIFILLILSSKVNLGFNSKLVGCDFFLSNKKEGFNFSQNLLKIVSIEFGPFGIIVSSPSGLVI